MIIPRSCFQTNEYNGGSICNKCKLHAKCKKFAKENNLLFRCANCHKIKKKFRRGVCCKCYFRLKKLGELE